MQQPRTLLFKSRWIIPLFLLIIAISGCAGKSPKTTGLAGRTKFSGSAGSPVAASSPTTSAVSGSGTAESSDLDSISQIEENRSAINMPNPTATLSVSQPVSFTRYAPYTLACQSERAVLDIAGGSADIGAKARNAAENGGYSQLWFITPAGYDTFLIINLHASKALTENGAGQPATLAMESGQAEQLWRFGRTGEGTLEITNSASGRKLQVESRDGSGTLAPADWQVKPVSEDYPVPEPHPLDTGNYRVGAQMCNLWNTDGWTRIISYPERKPFLGWYPEGTPLPTDWEIKAAVEHGIGFFMTCWYRDKNNLGKSPVEVRLDHWIRGLSNCRYADRIKFMIMWENANDIACGVADEKDFLDNVVPYWINHYFTHPSYLVLDGKPVLAIYAPSRLTQNLGSDAGVRQAMAKAEQRVIAAGFKGLTLLGQYCWGSPAADHAAMKEQGLQYTFSYHWPTFATGALPSGKTTFTGAEILAGHRVVWEKQAQAKLPNIVTCSMGWDSSPWNNSVTSKKWQLTPGEFQQLLTDAKSAVDARNTSGLEGRMVLLDNWNEFGEGHYIMPTAKYGFGYLDAVRNVFGQ